MSQISGVARRTFSILAVLILCSLAARAQFRAGIQGAVIDPSGAVVPNVNLELTNEETGFKQQTVSGPEGTYRFNQLAPGPYTVAATAPGFQRAVREHFNVRAEQVEGLDLTISPGEVATAVTVSEDSAPQLQTETASITGTISSKEIKSLPQAGRSPYELIRLTPGVFGQGAHTASGGSQSLPNTSGPGGTSFNAAIFQTENQVPISANGQRVTANGYQIDGVNVNSQAWGGAAVVTPSQEAVKEITVVSNSYSAENGRNSGALVQVVSQNGSNQLHGSFFGKVDNPDLNAYTRWGGPHGEAPQRVNADYNQWGGSLGGPIWKNHLFFFFAYETVRSSASTLSNSWVETPQFSSLVKTARPNSIASTILNINGITPRIANTSPRTCASAGYTDPTQCQDVSGGIDIGSPGGTLGTTVGPLGGGLDTIPDLSYAQLTIPSNLISQQYNGRADFRASSNDLIAVSVFYVPSDTTSNDLNYNGRPVEDWTSSRLNQNGAVLWNRTFNATTINELRFNVTRWFFNEIKSNLKMPWGIPRDQINAPQYALNFGPPGPGVFYQTTHNIRDTLSKVVNSHSLKIGFDLAFEQNNDTVAWAARPTYDFGNLWNFVNDAPLDENGNFDPRNGHPTDLKKYVRSQDNAIFIQDDWKARPNLTLNLGLRWEYFSPLSEKYGNISNTVLGTGVDPLTSARVQIGGQLWGGDNNNFGPQLGFAWSPKAIMGYNLQNRMVLRGGYGIGYNRVPESITLNGRLNPPFFGTFSLPQSQVVYSTASGINSFYGWPANPYTILQFNPVTNLPVAGANFAKPDLYGIPIDMPTPYTQRYSLELQYDLGANWIAALAFQGGLGRKMPRIVNYSLFFDPNPGVNSVKFIRNDVSSNYNAMLLRASHRFARTFEVNAQYRWSKSLDTCSNDDNCAQTYPFDQRTEYGPSDFDVTHSFTALGVWTLPLRGSNSWATSLLGGWELDGIITATSGFPWTPVYNGANCTVIANRGGICPARPVAFFGGVNYDNSTDAFKNGTNFPGGALKYFEPPPAGNFPVPPLPGIGRNVFRGPRYFDVDLSAAKRFKLPKMPLVGEDSAIEIRANAFNLFNKLNLQAFLFNSASTQINSGDFGRATTPLAGRVVEFQARFSF
jgi:hypothetical protein